MIRGKWIVLIASFCFMSSAMASGDQGRSIEVDEKKVAQWNRFSSQLLRLHQKLIGDEPVRKQERVGGYRGEFFNNPDFYREETYHRAGGKLLLSRVKWEKDTPGNVHTLELFRYDDQDRVVRDYLVAYLPWGRNAPIQALVNVHAYNGEMHSFRQFDASGVLVYEHCSGESNGKPVQISLEPHEMIPPITTSQDYVACFAGLPSEAGELLVPR